MQQFDEIGARILVSEALAPIRNLYTVHKALGTGGWVAVQALGDAVILRALAEAEILQDADPSPLLQGAVDRLRMFRAAAAVRTTRDAIEGADLAWAMAAAPEVSEASHEEYELMERSWIGTVPQAYEPTGPHPL